MIAGPPAGSLDRLGRGACVGSASVAAVCTGTETTAASGMRMPRSRRAITPALPPSATATATVSIDDVFGRQDRVRFGGALIPRPSGRSMSRMRVVSPRSCPAMTPFYPDLPAVLRIKCPAKRFLRRTSNRQSARCAYWFMTALSGFGGNAASVLAPRIRSRAYCSWRSSLASGGT